MTKEITEKTEFHTQLDNSLKVSHDKFISSGWWHSVDLGNGRVTAGVHPLATLRGNYDRFDLPKDLSGKRVMDIGCWDGFYSFEAERNGAEVVAIDCWRPETMLFAQKELNSQVKFYERSVYELNTEEFGAFDIVLFLGVLYHIPYPLLALRRVCEMTKDIAIIESYVIDGLIETRLPVMEFYELDELGGQYDNWWGPNSECLIRMARAAGFAHVELLRCESTRAVIKCYRRWNVFPSALSPAMRVHDVVNSVMLNRRLSRRGRFNLLSIFVEGVPPDVNRGDLQIQVGDFGSNPIQILPPTQEALNDQSRLNTLSAPGIPVDASLRKLASWCTQIIAPVPPGLSEGETTLQVFCNGMRTNEFPIKLYDSSEW